MLSTAEFWVAVSFFIFSGLLIYLKVPGMVTDALDQRAERIAAEIADAQKLREEAQVLLSEYEMKRKEAEQEAEAIVAQAKTEAENYAAETRRKLSENVERRTRLAEERIARAETQAIKNVRAMVTDRAVAAASEIIAEQAKGTAGAQMIDESIDALKTRLN